MLKNILIAIPVIVFVLCCIVVLGLRDHDARVPIGEPRSAQSGEATIHYYVAGDPGGSPVVLLASFARSVADFNELVDALAGRHYRTIGMQIRGIDGSTLTRGNSYRTYANDLAAVLDAEQISRQTPVVIIGHAWGNRIARTFASDFPQRTKGLILLAAGGETLPPPEVGSAIMRGMFSVLPESYRQRQVRFSLFADTSELPEHWVSGWFPLAGFQQASAMARSPFEQWGAGGTAPILILQPAEDSAAPVDAHALQQRFPERVELYEIPAAGHALLPEQPDIVFAHIQRALGKMFN